MTLIEKVGDRIEIEAEYREAELIRMIPGANWDRGKSVWHLKLSWASCLQARGVFGPLLGVGPELSEWARAELAHRIDPCLYLRTLDDIEYGSDMPDVMAQLFPFQRVGATFMAKAGQALLGDDCGTGKTVQALAALEITGGYPALVVTPNSVKDDWRAEVEKWIPHRSCVVVEGIVTKRRKQLASGADITVINWEALNSHSRLAPFGNLALSDKEKTPGELNEIPWVTVVGDEIHRGKDPTAKQTRALWSVAHGPSVVYRYGLSGTPVADSPLDLWSIMHFIAPREYPTRSGYTDRYCISQLNNFGFTEVKGVRYDTSEELFRILDPRFLRRLKAQVLPWLPEKMYHTRHVTMGTKQKKAYEQMREQKLAELENGILLATNPLSEATRLLQFASAYGALGDPAFEVWGDGARLGAFPSREDADSYASQIEGAGVRNVTPLYLTEPSTKVDELEVLLEELGTQPAIVFAESRQLLEIAEKRLTEHGVGCALFTGTTTAEQREQAKANFKTGRIRVLLLTFGAGGEGLTLTTAANVIFLQRSFSEIKNQQAEDRVHRPGQDADKVVIWDIITDNTIESRVHATRIEKQGISEEIVRDYETMKRWLSK